MASYVHPLPCGGERASADAVCALIGAVLARSFAHYEISLRGRAITIDLWQEGVALEAAAIQAGGESGEDWAAFRQNMTAMAASVRGLIRAAGRGDMALNINVLNDIDRGHALLSTLETDVVYDCLA